MTTFVLEKNSFTHFLGYYLKKVMKDIYLHRLSLLKQILELDLEEERLWRQIGPKMGKQGQENIKMAQISRRNTIELYKQQQAAYQSWLAKQNNFSHELQ